MTWEMVSLRSVGKIVSGSTPKTKNDNYWGGPINWITPAELIKGYNGYIAETSRTLTEEGYKSANLNLLPKGSVLLTSRAPIGKVALAGSSMCTNQGFKSIICDDKLVCNKYLYHYLITQYDRLNYLGRGATFKEISKKIVEEIKIPLPPLETQKQIVELLDRAHALIDKRKEQIALIDQLIQSLFYDMFGDPVKNPLGLDIKKLEEILFIKHGYAFKSDFFSDTGLFVLLTPGNFYEDGGYRDRGDKQKYYLGEIPNNYILEEGQILVAMTEQAPGLLGSPIIVPESNRFLHNQRLGLVIPSLKNIDTVFLSCFFNTSYFREKLQFTSTGTKVKHTSPSKIHAVEIPLPPINLQKIFAERVQKIETQKEAMTTSLHELENNFNSLMQRAFKGELKNE